MKPKILITNDDGIEALGIKHLWNSLKDIADITVVAPSSEQSSVSLSITTRAPLLIKEIAWEEGVKVWSVSGTPADCVKMATNVILNSPPDLLVSGINRGSNAGRNLLYSGTVAGAIEGTLRNIPSIAFSARDYLSPGYHYFEQFVPKIVNYVLENPLPKGTLLNVNFPQYDPQGIQGFKMTRQGLEFWGEAFEERKHPVEGHSYYWMGAKLCEFEEDIHSDIAWLKKGFITAVPVHINELTDHSHLEKQKINFEKLLEYNLLESNLA